MSRAAGALLAVTGFLACPCHLAFTLPLAIVLFGGTAVGAFLTANTELVVLAVTLYFFVGLGSGLYLLSRQGSGPAKTPQADASAACCPPAFTRRGSKQARASARRPADDISVSLGG